MDLPFISPTENTAAYAIEAIREELELFDDWMQRYRYLIDLGETLPLFPEKWQNDQHRILGCQSQVWFNYSVKDNHIFFAGSSDAAIVRGLIALLLRIYSGRSAIEILSVDINFIKELGLSKALSSNRSNGIASMINYIQDTAKNLI